jgi:hypothetical protein
MITFKVIKERFGWALRTGEGMTSHFRLKSVAEREANRLAAAIRQHGVHAEVIIDAGDLFEAPNELAVAGRIDPSSLGGRQSADPR